MPPSRASASSARARARAAAAAARALSSHELERRLGEARLDVARIAESRNALATDYRRLAAAMAPAADADDDADGSTIGWTVDGVSAGSDATLAGVFSGGSVVMCTITPNDGTDTGTSLTASLTIDNTAPSIIAAQYCHDHTVI